MSTSAACTPTGKTPPAASSPPYAFTPGAAPTTPALAELVGELSVHDTDFRRWWADHDVFERSHGVKHFHHPVVGDLVLNYEAFTPTDDPEQVLGISTAEPGSVSAERLKLLASWADYRQPPNLTT